MISNEGLSGSMFGTGRLLDDLVQFVYSGQGCRLLLMGDTAQLPPVGGGAEPCPLCRCLERLRAGSGGGGLDAGGASGATVGHFVECHPPEAV